MRRAPYSGWWHVPPPPREAPASASAGAARPSRRLVRPAPAEYAPRRRPGPRGRRRSSIARTPRTVEVSPSGTSYELAAALLRPQRRHNIDAASARPGPGTRSAAAAAPSPGASPRIDRRVIASSASRLRARRRRRICFRTAPSRARGPYRDLTCAQPGCSRIGPLREGSWRAAVRSRRCCGLRPPDGEGHRRGEGIRPPDAAQAPGGTRRYRRPIRADPVSIRTPGPGARARRPHGAPEGHSSWEVEARVVKYPVADRASWRSRPAYRGRRDRSQLPTSSAARMETVRSSRRPTSGAGVRGVVRRRTSATTSSRRQQAYTGDGPGRISPPRGAGGSILDCMTAPELIATRAGLAISRLGQATSVEAARRPPASARLSVAARRSSRVTSPRRELLGVG